MDDRSRLSDGEALSFSGRVLDVGLVGVGRVGSAVGRALTSKGHRIEAVSARTPDSAGAAATEFGATETDPSGVAKVSDLVVIAVADDALASVVEQIAPSCAPGTWVIHTCGRFGTAPLGPCGGRVAAIHPAAPVASGAARFDDIPFGVTCAEENLPFAEWLVAELGGTPVFVRESFRTLYHAALVIASNFTTGLAGDAIDLAGREVVLPLLRATLGNLEHMDPNAALTGPVVRGDAGTIRAHLRALESAAPALRDAYVANSRRLLQRARTSGRLSEEAAKAVEEVLR